LTLTLLGSAAWASCMPCQDEALNDLSSMPPVSVTMHPLNDAVDALLDELLGELLLDEPPDELLPHAAASSASTLSAAAAGMERLTESSYFDGVRSAITGC
jgi:hypothetical protein